MYYIGMFANDNGTIMDAGAQAYLRILCLHMHIISFLIIDAMYSITSNFNLIFYLK